MKVSLGRSGLLPAQSPGVTPERDVSCRYSRRVVVDHRGAALPLLHVAPLSALHRLGHRPHRLAIRDDLVGPHAHRPGVGDHAVVTFRLVLKREDPHALRGVRIFAVDAARAPADEFVTDGRPYRARPDSLHAA